MPLAPLLPPLSHFVSHSLPLSASPQWYTVCNHDWSFLEGEKRHSHTLKAGFHRFPFQLKLGGSLPSSIRSGALGSAHISYKLRAVAVRPGLAHNMQAVMPIYLVRTFASEALEYQQSLEIENTWPGKLMYSIMIPHKAWAAGDQLTAIVKFSPLSKGVRVLAVTTMIHEITKLHCRGGVQEHTHSVVTAHHEVPNTEQHTGTYGRPSFPLTPGLSSEDRSQSFGSLVALANQDTLRQVPRTASSSSSEYRSIPAPPLPSSDPSASSAEPVATPTQAEVPISRDDIAAHLTVFIPKYVTPSHPLEPITVFHRIRWSIFMSNPDGHTSELRCSLPLHILDARLLDEARANSAATRRLLLVGTEVPVDEEQDVELPSYSAHVRDRVANMYLPDSATTRVLNPWVHGTGSPTFMPEHQSLSGAWSPPGAASPSVPHPVSSHLPHVPQSGTSTPLDWVDSELLLSLSNTAPPLPRVTASPLSHSPSDLTSQPGSGPASRRGSRASSTERHFTMTTITPLPAPPISTSHETFVHDGHASRTLPGLFSIQMKPLTSLTSSGWLSSRSNSRSDLTSLVDVGLAHRASVQSHYAPRQPSAAVPLPAPVSVLGSQMATPTPATTESVPESTLWRRAFTEVPDYDAASRGFIGGVTPLTSMRGLPSYEEVERSANGGGGVDGDEARLTIQRAASRRGRAE